MTIYQESLLLTVGHITTLTSILVFIKCTILYTQYSWAIYIYSLDMSQMVKSF